MKTILNTKSPNSIIESIGILDDDCRIANYSPDGKVLVFYPHDGRFQGYHLPAITEEVLMGITEKLMLNYSKTVTRNWFDCALSQFLTDHGHTLDQGGYEGAMMAEHPKHGTIFEQNPNALDPNGLIIKLRS